MKRTIECWEIDQDGVTIITNTGEQVARADGKTIYEERANAHLITAAPELLEAIKKLLDVVETSCINEHKYLSFNRFAVIEAEKAIAKAEGSAK